MSVPVITLGKDAAVKNARRFTFPTQGQAFEAKRHADMFGIPSVLGTGFEDDWVNGGTCPVWTLTLDPLPALETDTAA